MTDSPEGRGFAPRPMTRRAVLRGIAGVAGLSTIPGLLAACASPAAPSTPGAPPIASSASPAVPAPSALSTAGLTLASYLSVSDVIETFRSETGIGIKVNTVFANDFGDELDTYLAATPEDVITTGTGFSMRTEAAKGLLTAIDDIWADVGSSFSGAIRVAVSGDDGHRYCMPTSQYPWAVFYRRSVFAKHGYAVPTTWDEYKALAGRMQRDGLVPIAFGNKALYPAMGTFDIINMRLNGYQFHVDLLAGKERWGDARVKDVFLHWKELVPLTQPGANGRTLDQAAQALLTKQAGMYYFGMFFTASQDVDQAALDDLDMFPFPSMGTAFDAEKAIDAPTDGFVITSRSPTLPADLDSVKAFMEFLARGTTQTALAAASGVIAPSNDAVTSGYSSLQQAARDLMTSSTRAAQFFDRDTDRAFALKFGGLLQDFLTHQDQDLGVFLGQIQAAWTAP